MATTRVYRLFVLLFVAFSLALQLQLALPRGEATVESTPMLLAGDDSPHIGG